MISRTVYNQLFDAAQAESEHKVIRLDASGKEIPPPAPPTRSRAQNWTPEEHNRFLEALEIYPAGPWKRIAEHIGTKTPRQTMTHAQKYRQKILRRERGLRNQGKRGKESDEELPTAPKRQKKSKKDDSCQSEKVEPTSATYPPAGNTGFLDILANQATQKATLMAREAGIKRESSLPEEKDTTAYPHFHHEYLPVSQSYPSMMHQPLPVQSNLPPLAEILQLRQHR